MRCSCGRRLVHLDVTGQFVEVPLCVRCLQQDEGCTCSPLAERTLADDVVAGLHDQPHP